MDSYSSAFTKVTAGRADGQVLGPWRCPPSAVSPRGPVLSERDFPTPHHFLLCCCGGRGGGFLGGGGFSGYHTTAEECAGFTQHAVWRVSILLCSLFGGSPWLSISRPSCSFCSFATRSDSPSGRFPACQHPLLPRATLVP